MNRLLSRHHSTTITAAAAALSCTLSCIYMNQKHLVASSEINVDAKKNTKGNASANANANANAYANVDRNERRQGLESNLMDKIANKSYLQYDKHNETKTKHNIRPEGVPESLRILVIDIPKFHEYMNDNDCYVDHKSIFPDGIANPRKIQLEISQHEKTQIHLNHLNKKSNDEDKDKDKDKEKHKHNIEVIQKSLIRSLSKCGKKNKTLLLEASISNLNPKQLKRRYEFQPVPKQITDTHEWIEMEMVSPKHQKAWIEEMDLRIHGKVPFTSALESSTKLSRFLFGNHYRTTIPSSTSIIRRVLLYPFTNPYRYHPDGIDTPNQNNRASNKPHAVIADGAAIISVPGSLLYLSRCCKEANVPLYIIHDPRSWGRNTHSDIYSALHDLRQTVKRNIVQNALSLKQGSAFERGRQWGKLEAQTEYKIKNRHTLTKKAIMDARKHLDDLDWSGLNSNDLKKEFIQKKLIIVKHVDNSNDHDHDHNNNDHGTTIIGYTNGMKSLLKELFPSINIDNDDDNDKNSNDEETFNENNSKTKDHIN